MHYIENKRKVRGLVEKGLKVLDRLLLAQVESEFVQKMLVHVTVFYIWDIRIDHKRNKVEDEVR